MDKYISKSKAELRKDEKHRSRSRSRSPKRKDSSPRDHRDHSRHSQRRRDERRRDSSTSSSSSSDERGRKRSEKFEAPPPPMISKISINLKSNKSSSPSGKLQMKLNVPVVKPAAPLPKPSVASAFNVDSDEEAEEMPPECKMRMKNIGKNTPTSSGPNSFGKTKIGFVDSKKIFEKKLMEIAKTMGD